MHSLTPVSTRKTHPQANTHAPLIESHDAPPQAQQDQSCATEGSPQREGEGLRNFPGKQVVPRATAKECKTVATVACVNLPPKPYLPFHCLLHCKHVATAQTVPSTSDAGKRHDAHMLTSTPRYRACSTHSTHGGVLRTMES